MAASAWPALLGGLLPALISLGVAISNAIMSKGSSSLASSATPAAAGAGSYILLRATAHFFPESAGPGLGAGAFLGGLATLVYSAGDFIVKVNGMMPPPGEPWLPFLSCAFPLAALVYTMFLIAWDHQLNKSCWQLTTFYDVGPHDRYECRHQISGYDGPRPDYCKGEVYRDAGLFVEYRRTTNIFMKDWQFEPRILPTSIVPESFVHLFISEGRPSEKDLYTLRERLRYSKFVALVFGVWFMFALGRAVGKSEALTTASPIRCSWW